MKHRELMTALLIAAMMSACGEKKAANPEPTARLASQVNSAAAESAAEQAPPSALPSDAAEAAARGELPHSLFGDEYALDADDSLADADLEGVNVQLEVTTNNFAAAHQVAYVRALEARSQARQNEALLAYNRSVSARTEDPEQEKVDARIAAAMKGSDGASNAAGNPAGSAAAALAAPSGPAAAAVPQFDEAAVLSDKNGQWANKARASSYYGGETGAAPPYGALQATGAPNVPKYSDSPHSWTAKADGVPTVEWLLLDYAKSVHATAVRVRQNLGPGAISKIELLDEAGAAHTVWEGLDETAYPKNSIGWFVREFPRTDYLVKQVRVSLLNNRVWGYNEIDAVQLVGDP